MSCRYPVSIDREKTATSASYEDVYEVYIRNAASTDVKAVVRLFMPFQMFQESGQQLERGYFTTVSVKEITVPANSTVSVKFPLKKPECCKIWRSTDGGSKPIPPRDPFLAVGLLSLVVGNVEVDRMTVTFYPRCMAEGKCNPADTYSVEFTIRVVASPVVDTFPQASGPVGTGGDVSRGLYAINVPWSPAPPGPKFLGGTYKATPIEYRLPSYDNEFYVMFYKVVCRGGTCGLDDKPTDSGGNYWRIDIYDPLGVLIHSCPVVNEKRPCKFSLSQPCENCVEVEKCSGVCWSSCGPNKCCCVETPSGNKYSVRFYHAAGEERNFTLLVCVDKEFGGSWSDWDRGTHCWYGRNAAWTAYITHGSAISPPFEPKRKIVAAVGNAYDNTYFRVEIVDMFGNVVKRCDRVDQYTPCIYEVPAGPPSGSGYCLQPETCKAAGGTCTGWCAGGCCCQLPQTQQPPQQPPQPPPQQPTSQQQSQQQAVPTLVPPSCLRVVPRAGKVVYFEVRDGEKAQVDVYATQVTLNGQPLLTDKVKLGTATNPQRLIMKFDRDISLGNNEVFINFLFEFYKNGTPVRKEEVGVALTEKNACG